jgi:hypothetical protein
MFIQFCRGHVTSGREVLELFDRWEREQRASAIGFLGATAGVTDDGEVVIFARFASAEEAKRNEERAEQNAWWAEFEKRFDGPMTVLECRDVATFLDGGRNDAGFVQVIQSPSRAAVTAAPLAAATERAVRTHRPDVLGGFVAVAEDGTVLEAVYFTSEAAARDAEALDRPDDVIAEMDAATRGLGDPTYLDLHQPVFA